MAVTQWLIHNGGYTRAFELKGSLQLGTHIATTIHNYCQRVDE